MIACLGALGILRDHRMVVLALAMGCWLFTLVDAVTGSGLLADTYTVKYVSVFLIGSAMFLYADRVPLARSLVVPSLVLLVAGLLIPGYYRVLGLIPLAYLLLYAGTSRRLARVGARRDLSYGIYIYGWPIQLLLAQVGIGTQNVGIHIPVSVLAATAAAFVSWRLVEAPALAYKSFTPHTTVTGSRRAGSPG